MTDVEKKFIQTPPNFYYGVIEDNEDPLKQGRYRVRLLGVDSMNKNLVPTDTLPWARSINSFGLISGIGLTRFYRKGTMVVCLLLNNNRMEVVILGSIEGAYTPKDELKKAGIECFQDPDGKYPIEGKSNYDETAYGKKEAIILKNETNEIALNDNDITVTRFNPEGTEPKTKVTMTENDIMIETLGDNPTSIKVDGASGNIEMKCKKLKIENEEGAEIVTLLDQLVDHILAEVRIGNLGAPCAMDPGSMSNYQQLKQKIATIKA